MALGFIVSPAKKMNVVEGPPYVEGMPQHLARTEELLRALRALSYDEAKELWRCSDRLAEENYARLKDMCLEDARTAAVIAYEGIQYQHLAAQVMSENELDYLGKHLRILSGFYGVLRPFDAVVPYRLEMQARLPMPAREGHPATRNLYEWWGDTLARTLAEAGMCGPSMAASMPLIPGHKHSSIPSAYSAEEVSALLDVEPSGRCPLRTRAMMLFAAVLGMRVGDIRSVFAPGLFAGQGPQGAPDGIYAVAIRKQLR